VKLVGADRGALSWELLDLFEGGGVRRCRLGDDTPIVRQAAADLPWATLWTLSLKPYAARMVAKSSGVKTQVANVPR